MANKKPTGTEDVQVIKKKPQAATLLSLVTMG